MDYFREPLQSIMPYNGTRAVEKTENNWQWVSSYQARSHTSLESSPLESKIDR
jgi:hypothetical protein